MGRGGGVATVDDVVAAIKRTADAHLEGGEGAKGAVVAAMVALVTGEPVDVARLRGVRGFEDGRDKVLERAYAAAGRPRTHHPPREIPPAIRPGGDVPTREERE